MSIRFISKGDWGKTFGFLKKLENSDYERVLDECGRLGVEALSNATPKDSGITASSWTYDIEHDGKGVKIVWRNTNLAKGWFNVAIALQYGHGTGTGGYVQGVDYINPAIRPVFDNIANTVWEVVKSQ